MKQFRTDIFLALFLSILGAALQATPVAAAFSIEYQAPADPTTEGFSALVAVGPAPQVLQMIWDIPHGPSPGWV